jgi:methylamine dehydrogenase accessory protein MauD
MSSLQTAARYLLWVRIVEEESAVEGWWAASYVVLWLLVVALAAIVVALARQIGTLHLRVGPRGALEMDAEGPELGSKAIEIETTDMKGRAVAIGKGGEDQLLLFVSPTCHVCERVLPALPAAARAGNLVPYVVTDTDAEETVSQFTHKRVDAPIVPGVAIAQAYEIPGTPYIVAIDSRGVVQAKGTVNNMEQVEGLVDTFHRRAGEHMKAV